MMRLPYPLPFHGVRALDLRGARVSRRPRSLVFQLYLLVHRVVSTTANPYHEATTHADLDTAADKHGHQLQAVRKLKPTGNSKGELIADTKHQHDSEQEQPRDSEREEELLDGHTQRGQAEAEISEADRPDSFLLAPQEQESTRDMAAEIADLQPRPRVAALEAQHQADEPEHIQESDPALQQESKIDRGGAASPPLPREGGVSNNVEDLVPAMARKMEEMEQQLQQQAAELQSLRAVDGPADKRTTALEFAHSLQDNTTDAIQRIRDVGAINERVSQKMASVLLGILRTDAQRSALFTLIAFLAVLFSSLLPLKLVLFPPLFPTAEDVVELRRRGMGRLVETMALEEYYVLPWNFAKRGTLSSVCQVQNSPEGIIFSSCFILAGVCLILSQYTFLLHSPWCFMKQSQAIDLGMDFAVTQTHNETILRTVLLLVPAICFILTAAMPAASFDEEEIGRLDTVIEQEYPAEAPAIESYDYEAEQQGGEKDGDTKEAAVEKTTSPAEAPRQSNLLKHPAKLLRHVTESRKRRYMKVLELSHNLFAPTGMALMLMFETVQIFLGEGVPVLFGFQLFGLPTGGSTYHVEGIRKDQPWWEVHYDPATGSHLSSCQKRALMLEQNDTFLAGLAARALVVLLAWLFNTLFVLLGFVVYFRVYLDPHAPSGPLVPTNYTLLCRSTECMVLEVLAVCSVFLLPVLRAGQLLYFDNAVTDSEVLLDPGYHIGASVREAWKDSYIFWRHPINTTGTLQQPCGTTWDLVPEATHNMCRTTANSTEPPRFWFSRYNETQLT
ncbi:unnamed protein product [Amoebophrya sp. A120]|nr:unnamed protein product [Amoebophrya sp. A120]|eukprot:GSA120T00002945001.1